MYLNVMFAIFHRQIICVSLSLQGVMFGGLVFGSLSDRFGRKSMMLVCLYTQCLIGIALHFVRRLVVFMGLRFIQGIFIQVRLTFAQV